ncbi:MAG: hypothetical protein RQ757_01840 [Pseudomonadales bacterium]|nr:hypothetical protein [Pseudomonadales bacterium]
MQRSIHSFNYDELLGIFWNALLISMFVGLGLNVNAFNIRNHEGRYRTLLDRYWYIRHNLANVMAFFVIPFCVSTASSIASVSADNNLLMAIFGTDSYALIILLGFVAFLLIPSIYVVLRYGFRVSGSSPTE